MLQYKYKALGLLLAIPSLVIGYLVYFQNLELAVLKVAENQNLTDEVALTWVITSLFLIALSKEKKEDEYINALRLDSWIWAVKINFGLLLVATWSFYDEAFFDVLVYNTFSIPVLFLLKFNWTLNAAKR